MSKEYKVTTLQEDVDDIVAGIFAIQEADEREKAEAAEYMECVDIPCNYRGASAGCDRTLSEIADEVGLGDSSFPKQNVNKILNRAVKKFTKNFYLMAIIHSAAVRGFSCDDAMDIAQKSCDAEIDSGKTPEEILREVADVKAETDFCGSIDQRIRRSGHVDRSGF